MQYVKTILNKHRRDLLATANAAELKLAEILDPHTEATVDQIRLYRVRAEEIARAIAILEQSDVVSIEDVR